MSCPDTPVVGLLRASQKKQGCAGRIVVERGKARDTTHTNQPDTPHHHAPNNPPIYTRTRPENRSAYHTGRFASCEASREATTAEPNRGNIKTRQKKTPFLDPLRA